MRQLTSSLSARVLSRFSSVFHWTITDTRLSKLLSTFLLVLGLSGTALRDNSRHGSYTAVGVTVYGPSCGKTGYSSPTRETRRGCRAGIKCQARRRRYKPFLPSVIRGNLRSSGTDATPDGIPREQLSVFLGDTAARTDP